MENEKLTADALRNVIMHLGKVADENRRNSDSYKHMFEASEKGIRGLLDKAESDMTAIALDTMEVIKQRFGYRGNDLWALLCCLPYARQQIEKNISKLEGSSCSVDKAREVFAQTALEIIGEVEQPTTEGKS
jgi:hypothetical protein